MKLQKNDQDLPILKYWNEGIHTSAGINAKYFEYILKNIFTDAMYDLRLWNYSVKYMSRILFKWKIYFYFLEHRISWFHASGSEDFQNGGKLKFQFSCSFSTGIEQHITFSQYKVSTCVTDPDDNNYEENYFIYTYCWWFLCLTFLSLVFPRRMCGHFSLHMRQGKTNGGKNHFRATGVCTLQKDFLCHSNIISSCHKIHTKP